MGIRSEKTPGEARVIPFSGDSFRVSFNLRFDGAVILDSADSMYLKLSGISEENVGGDISSVIPEVDLSRLRYYFDSYRGHEFRSRYVRSFCSFPEIMWRVDVKINYPDMECSGRIIRENSCSIYNCHIHENRSYRKADNTGVAVFDVDEKGITVDYTSDLMEKIFPELRSISFAHTRDEFIQSLLDAADRAVRRGRTVRYVQPGSGRKSKGMIFDVSVTPYLKNGKRSVIARISGIDEDEYERNMYSANESENIIGKYIIGSGIIDCSECDRFYLRDINPCLSGMISAGMISSASITGSGVFRSALESRMSSFGIIRGNDCSFCLGAVPMMRGTGDCDVMFIVFPADTHSMIDMSLLRDFTPREQNVIRLAAEGMENKYIATALGISEGTAKNELFMCYKKMGVSNKTGLILKVYNMKQSETNGRDQRRG